MCVIIARSDIERLRIRGNRICDVLACRDVWAAISATVFRHYLAAVHESLYGAGVVTVSSRKSGVLSAVSSFALAHDAPVDGDVSSSDAPGVRTYSSDAVPAVGADAVYAASHLADVSDAVSASGRVAAATVFADVFLRLSDPALCGRNGRLLRGRGYWGGDW